MSLKPISPLIRSSGNSLSSQTGSSATRFSVGRSSAIHPRFGRDVHVITAEDNPDIQTLFKLLIDYKPDIFGRDNVVILHQPINLQDAEEAYRKTLNSDVAPIVISDLDMPVVAHSISASPFAGLQLLEYIRNAMKDKKTFFALLSGRSNDREVRRQVKNQDGDVCLMKPIEPDEFYNLLRQGFKKVSAPPDCLKPSESVSTLPEAS